MNLDNYLEILTTLTTKISVNMLNLRDALIVHKEMGTGKKLTEMSISVLTEEGKDLSISVNNSDALYRIVCEEVDRLREEKLKLIQEIKQHQRTGFEE